MWELPEHPEMKAIFHIFTAFANIRTFEINYEAIAFYGENPLKIWPDQEIYLPAA